MNTETINKDGMIAKGISTITDKTGEYFNNLNKNEKYETFCSTIEDLKNNSFIQTCNKYRNELTEDQKIGLYKDGNYLKLSTGMINKMKHSLVGTNLHANFTSLWNLYKNGYKNAISDNIFRSVPQVCRTFIQLGILDKPEGLKIEDLKKDIKNDSKNLKRNLTFVKIVLPTLIDIITEGAGLAADPFIRIGLDNLIKCADWYKQEGCEMLISSIESNNIKTSTQNKLSTLLSQDSDSKQTA